MIKIFITIILLFLLFGCFKDKSVRFDFMPNTELLPVKTPTLDSDFEAALRHFNTNCKSKKMLKIYEDLCDKSLHVSSAKEFFLNNFNYYEVKNNQEDEKALLTGYYEPLLYGSRTYKKPYIYPLYRPPADLLHVNLSDSHKELKNMRLRGKLVDGKVISYDDRESINSKESNLSVICYVDDRISRFFLEVQGSGRVRLDNGDTIFVGYADQNGHAYTSIGKVLVEKKEIKKSDISLQSIRLWLEQHRKSMDKILNKNRSFVFFKERSYSATGALGVELTSKESVAVDSRYIPLGSLLSIDSESYKRVVFAEDTGGAIRGSVRADLFLGFGKKALKRAGTLKERVKLYIWLPKNRLVAK